jgi:hypothetical protein
MDRYDRRAFMAAVYAREAFCVWLDGKGETRVSRKSDVPAGAVITYTGDLASGNENPESRC